MNKILPIRTLKIISGNLKSVAIAAIVVAFALNGAVADAQ